MRKIFIFLWLSVVVGLEAKPEYSRRENKACVYCHFTANGGTRNFLGHYYSRQGYTFDESVYGRSEYRKQPPLPQDLSFQRPTAEGKLIDRRLEILKSINFRSRTGESYFAAGELIRCGREFVKKLDTAGIAYNKNLEEILVRNFFGFGKYNVEAYSLHAGMGLSMVHAPLVYLKSRNAKSKPEDYLKKRFDFFRKLANYSEPEELSPIYAEFASGDPHFTDKPDFKTGAKQKWDTQKMDKAIRVENMGWGLFAKSILASNYLASVHAEGVGITPKAGFYGQVLMYQMVNTMLWLRYGLGFDGASFRSFSPDYYDTRELMYIPNELAVEFDEKTGAPASYYVKERLSDLRTMGVLLMGLAEFYALTDPHRLSMQKVIGNGPDDSEDFPFSYNARYLAKELVLIALKNIETMHYDRRLGCLYSTATFVRPVRTVKTADMALTMMGLGKIFNSFYDDPEIRNVSGNLIYAAGQFLIQRLQPVDGGFGSSYDTRRAEADFLNRRLEDQALTVSALLEAFKVSRDERFYRSATRAYSYMVKNLWDEDLNTFRTHEESGILTMTPAGFGATVGALREMVLATGDLRTFAYLLAYFEGIMKNYSLQLSELDFTGEAMDEVRDSDGDNIFQSDMAGGDFGIAPVFASEVQVEPIRR
jgi:hypothetical protein